MKKRPRIKCRRCNGEGSEELDPILFGTLHILKEMKSCTAQEMLDALPEARVSVTAINKRLERLRRVGLVIREKCVKTWIYKPTKT